MNWTPEKRSRLLELLEYAMNGWQNSDAEQVVTAETRASDARDRAEFEAMVRELLDTVQPPTD